MSTPERLALDLAAALLGGQAGVSKTCGYKDRRNVWPWFSEGRPVPAEACAAIERATDGAVKCEQLRPDLDWVRIADRRWPWHRKGRPVLDVAKAVA
jgi:DNA-binding transcriptional regulator YdaS (Cro superfamily)